MERPDLSGETPTARCQMFYERGLAVEARTRDGLRRELGSPISVGSDTEPNRHVPDRTDTLWTIEYAGVEAELRTAGGNDLLERMVVRQEGALRFREPSIGTSEARLVSLLGEPYQREEGRLQYLCAPEPMPDVPVTFVLDGGSVAAVIWDYYVD